MISIRILKRISLEVKPMIERIIELQAIRVFFRTNQSTCQEWVNRMCAAALVSSFRAGHYASAARYGLNLLTHWEHTNKTLGNIQLDANQSFGSLGIWKDINCCAPNLWATGTILNGSYSWRSWNTLTSPNRSHKTLTSPNRSYKILTSPNRSYKTLTSPSRSQKALLSLDPHDPYDPYDVNNRSWMHWNWNLNHRWRWIGERAGASGAESGETGRFAPNPGPLQMADGPAAVF